MDSSRNERGPRCDGAPPSLDPSLASFLNLAGRALIAGTAGVDVTPIGAAPLPDRIDRFVLLEEIGFGAFGRVLRVWDTALEVERAMKLPNEATLASPNARERFREEMRRAAAIDHPNVVRLYAPGEWEGRPFQIMELCPGGSLAEWLRDRSVERPVPPRWAALLMAQVADGVQAAHTQEVIHRDLKPGNVLLVEIPGRDELPTFLPKVGDFGLAKALAEGAGRADLSEDGTPVGTRDYMSPEAARGVRSRIGPATDVYSLGVILFELLTGRRPGPEPDAALRVARRGLPRDLATICRACLAEDPIARYPNAGVLAENLRRFHRGEPVQGAAWWRRPIASLRKHPALSTAAGFLLLMMILGAGGLEYIQAKEAADWVRHVQHAEIADLPDLIRAHDPADRRVRGKLDDLFEHGDDRARLAAAVALAGLRRECADYAYTHLLKVKTSDVAPLARALHQRWDELIPYLDRDAHAPPLAAPPAAAEERDRGRARAAAVLELFGYFGAAGELLMRSPDPQARSFLIHELGSVGASPRRLLDALASTREPGTVAALAMALIHVRESAWEAEPGAYSRAVTALKGLYRDDPDPGVHGAAKWALLRRGFADDLARIDEALKGLDRPGFLWRIGHSGLTFVQFHDEETGRIVEVSDIEVPRSLFLRLDPRPASPGRVAAALPPDFPMTGLSYHDAAGFLNALNRLDAAEGAEHAASFAPRATWGLQPIAGWMDRDGFRLLTDREFEIACRAGTVTARYHGDTTALLAEYAWFDSRPDLVPSPVGLRKPNDFGLFDMLGNASELCHFEKADLSTSKIMAFCGGSLAGNANSSRSAWRFAPMDSLQKTIDRDFGFHAARTIRPARQGAAPR